MRKTEGLQMFTRTRSGPRVEGSVKVNGRVVSTFYLGSGVADKVTIELSTERRLPSRSPLHEKALNFEDLRPKLNIERRNINGSMSSNAAIIIGEPFKRGDKFGYGDIMAQHWMVPVVTMNYAGRLVQEDWFLCDMGVVPFGTPPRWNEQNYTVAVD